MIKNIIFDVGKVLIGWDPALSMRMIGFDESEITAVMKAIFTDKKIWNEEDRGVKTREEMSDFLVSFAPELEDLIRRFYADATISVTPMEYSREWITDLKNAGLHVYILSNFGEYAWNRAVELGAINFMDLVDGAVRSYEIHHVKPEPEIYQTVLSRYGLSAAECVFIDDVEANVQAARENGMEAIVFKGYEDAVCRLEEIGVI
ncbi:MAG: HAD family phosphatase [Lachnospiraceae bacterium]|nr:HAD family phosphatase [Lachnospiraceae bacterium]